MTRPLDPSVSEVIQTGDDQNEGPHRGFGFDASVKEQGVLGDTTAKAIN